MSLTRDQWVEMWETVQMLELRVQNGMSGLDKNKKLALRGIEKLKDQIQQVIGQME